MNCWRFGLRCPNHPRTGGGTDDVIVKGRARRAGLASGLAVCVPRSAYDLPTTGPGWTGRSARKGPVTSGQRRRTTRHSSIRPGAIRCQIGPPECVD
jgi:hypothetical protein